MTDYHSDKCARHGSGVTDDGSVDSIPDLPPGLTHVGRSDAFAAFIRLFLWGMRGYRPEATPPRITKGRIGTSPPFPGDPLLRSPDTIDEEA